MYQGPGLRLLAWLALALLVLWLIAFVALGYPWTVVGSSTDALSYLWTADALTHGVSRPESAFGAKLLFQGRLPPGYPIYLSAFGAGVGDGEMLRANLAQMFAVLSMMALIFAHARHAIGARLPALLILIYILAHPMVTPWAFELFSEPLYTALLMAICLIAASDRLPRAWLWAAVLIGFACLVRSIGLFLIPALALWLLAQRLWTRAIIASVVAAAPTLLWSLAKGAAADGAGGSYLAQLQSVLATADGQWMQLATTQLASLLRSFAPGGLPDALRLLIGSALLTLFLRVAWMQRRHPTFDTLAVLSTLAMLAVWPFPGYLDRLSGPIVPLMLISILHHWFRQRAVEQPQREARKAWFAGAGGAIALAAMVSTLLTLARPSIWTVEPELRPFMRNASALLAKDPAFIAKIHFASSLAARGLAEQIPAGQCVSSSFAYWVRLFAPVPVADTSMPFSWEQNPCRFVFLVNLASAGDGFNGFYPMPLPEDQYSLVFISRESPETPVLAAMIERRDH